MTNDVERLAAFYVGLNEATLPQLAQYYAAGAGFKDPFNDVRGLPAIHAVFAHMYRKLDAPRFVVHVAQQAGQQGFMTWDMHFRFKDSSTPQVVRGASHVVFDAQGLVSMHRDYWDAAEELYEKLPLLGWLMRRIRQRVNAG